MKCPECGNVFKKEGNRTERIDGTKITVCPNCGNEQLDEKVPWDSNRCQICGKTMERMNDEHVCSKCKIKHKF